jgi:hypothetical protein
MRKTLSVQKVDGQLYWNLLNLFCKHCVQECTERDKDDRILCEAGAKYREDLEALLRGFYKEVSADFQHPHNPFSYMHRHQDHQILGCKVCIQEETYRAAINELKQIFIRAKETRVTNAKVS